MTRNLLAYSFFSAFALLAAPAGSASAAPCGTENLLAGKKPHLASDMKGDVALITDGNVGPEGAQWDAPVTVTFDQPTGAVTYDLGEARSVSAVVVQADANDVYKVSGSVDGAPSSYKPLSDVSNVVSRGHGLRTRALEFPATTIRYLRVGEASGDGYFSYAEIAAYCKKPSPFPPTFKIVDAPVAQVGQAPPPTTATSKDGGRSFLLLAVAALGLAWLAYRTIKRGTAAKPPEGGPSEPPTAASDTADTSDKPPGEGGGSSSGSAGPGPGNPA
jgi:hypothetical protein